MGTGRATLEDPAALRAADPGGMLGLVAAQGAHLRHGYAAGRTASGLPSGQGVRAVVVCGMGGSGVAGDVVRSLYAGRLPYPVVAVKGYALPEFCGRDALVLAVSFSGDTEETLAAYAQAVDRGCRVVAVSAGGELARLAAADQVPHVPVPSEGGVPRAAVGYLAGSALGVLEAVGLVPPASEEVGATADLLDRLAGELGPERPPARNEAKAVAAWLEGRVPVVWSAEGLAEAAALRWKTQLNENAKVPAFCSVVPELDHNEVEGWTSQTGGRFAVVALRHRGEHPRAAHRLDATVELVGGGGGPEVRQVAARGATSLQWLFSLIMVGDFASTYLGILRGVDPTPVPVLTGLKERLRR